MTRSRGIRGGSVEKRFWQRVEKHEGCWRWTGSLSHNGYGRFFLGARAKRRTAAHRVSWELHYGEIPPGLSVLHRCDNPCCVNPAHLFLGTVQDNTDDKMNKGREAKGSKHGLAKFDEEAVASIKVALMMGSSQSEIARRHGVTRTAIHSIAKGKTWRHVKEA